MRTGIRAALFLGALSMGGVVTVGSAGCQRVKMPHEEPGPAGCGKQDPRKVAPNMLSVAQNQARRKQGEPDDVRDNAHGGLDWVYSRATGSVFGSKETIEVFSFNAEGILVDKKTEVVARAGKE